MYIIIINPTAALHVAPVPAGPVEPRAVSLGNGESNVDHVIQQAQGGHRVPR